MEYAIMGLTFGLCLFILPLWSYRRGLKDGLALSQGKPIEPIQNPVTSFVEFREKQTEKQEAKEANDYMQEGMKNIFGYTGDPQEKVGEK